MKNYKKDRKSIQRNINEIEEIIYEVSMLVE